MPAVGGSIESISLDGRNFVVAADADSNRMLGGFTNEVQSNGDGSARTLKTRMPWSVDGLTASLDDDRGDQEFLQVLSDRTDNFPISIIYPSGAIYQGTGQIVDDISGGSQSATAPIKLSGPGRLTKQ